MPERNPKPNQPLAEGVDYYMDGPWLVFTREYHLKRGFCCQSGCRHCPWDYKKTGDTPSNPARS